MEIHADLTHKGISLPSSLEWLLGCRHIFQPCPYLLHSQYILVVLSLGSRLTAVKAPQITFAPLLFHTLDNMGQQTTKEELQERKGVGEEGIKWGERQLTLIAIGYVE